MRGCCATVSPINGPALLSWLVLTSDRTYFVNSPDLWHRAAKDEDFYTNDDDIPALTDPAQSNEWNYAVIALPSSLRVKNTGQFDAVYAVVRSLSKIDNVSATDIDHLGSIEGQVCFVAPAFGRQVTSLKACAEEEKRGDLGYVQAVLAKMRAMREKQLTRVNYVPCPWPGAAKVDNFTVKERAALNLKLRASAHIVKTKTENRRVTTEEGFGSITQLKDCFRKAWTVEQTAASAASYLMAQMDSYQKINRYLTSVFQGVMMDGTIKCIEPEQSIIDCTHQSSKSKSQAANRLLSRTLTPCPQCVREKLAHLVLDGLSRSGAGDEDKQCGIEFAEALLNRLPMSKALEHPFVAKWTEKTDKAPMFPLPENVDGDSLVVSLPEIHPVFFRTSILKAATDRRTITLENSYVAQPGDRYPTNGPLYSKYVALARRVGKDVQFIDPPRLHAKCLRWDMPLVSIPVLTQYEKAWRLPMTVAVVRTLIGGMRASGMEMDASLSNMYLLRNGCLALQRLAPDQRKRTWDEEKALIREACAQLPTMPELTQFVERLEAYQSKAEAVQDRLFLQHNCSDVPGSHLKLYKTSTIRRNSRAYASTRSLRQRGSRLVAPPSTPIPPE